MDQPRTAGDRDHTGRYEIRIRGHLDRRWSVWFDGMALTQHSDGTTTLRGQVADQAALHGLIQRVRDTGLPLISVNPIHPTGSDRQHTALRP